MKRERLKMSEENESHGLLALRFFVYSQANGDRGNDLLQITEQVRAEFGL